MDTSLVSVIMPVYNAEKYIGKAVESILGQSYENFELVIVDDCGSDHSMEILSKYKDYRIKIYHNNSNMGIAYSRNRAIKESLGRYIAIMDDDDVSMPDRLMHQVAFLENNPTIDIVGGQSSIIDENDIIIASPELMQENWKMNKVMFLFYNSFHNSETLIRKQLIDVNGIEYKDHMLGMEDFKFWIDCSTYGRISNINEEVLRYRVTGQNETSRVRNEQKKERKELFNRLRQYSLEKNGYVLRKEEMEAINSVVNEEGNGTFSNSNQVIDMFQTMHKIVQQAREMDAEYLNELQMWFKIIFNNKFSDSTHQSIWRD